LNGLKLNGERLMSPLKAAFASSATVILLGIVELNALYSISVLPGLRKVDLSSVLLMRT